MTMHPRLNISLPNAKSFDLETFTFNGRTLRTVLIDGAPWFLLTEVLDILGITAGGGNYRAFPEEEVTLIKRSNSTFAPLFPAGRGTARLILLAGPGLYRLALRAQRSNPAAKDFQDWITKVVIPSIRKDGGRE